MKYKSKLKWLISGLVLLSAASISAVAVACTPKDSSPSKPSKPNDTKKSNPQNSLSKPSDNKVSTPSKPKPNNPLSSQPKKNPSDTKKDSVDKTTKPSDPTNNQKDKDETGKNKVDKDQKDQTPKMPETKKEDKDDSSRQMDGDGNKNQIPNKMDDQNKPDNSNSSGSISNPKQPEVQNKPKDTDKLPGDDPMASDPIESAPKKDQPETQDGKPKQNDPESGSLESKPKGDQAPETHQAPPIDIDKNKDKDQSEKQEDKDPNSKDNQKQPEGQNQTPKEKQPNEMDGQDPKTHETTPQPNQDGNSNGNNMGESNQPIEEKVYVSKPLVTLKDEEPYINLYPGSNEGRLTLLLDKQQYKGNLKDKYIVVGIKKDESSTPIISVPFLLKDDSKELQLLFKPVIEFNQYKLHSVSIFSKESDSSNKPKETIELNIKKSDANKTINVKQIKLPKQIPESEKEKKPIVIKFNDADNKLQLNVKQKDGQPVNDVYLKFILTELDSKTKEYVSPDYNLDGKLLIQNGSATIEDVNINEDYKKKYDKVVLKIFGIFEKNNDTQKSSQYRFDYDDENTVIDHNGNLIISKTINKG
ncbi:hypothetical protein JM47_03720 [Ureaplasma diversum]|uniref:Uncharacterized protein n=1 Tax=Ureaplasma diversum TaxID=42094 RepID=A0A0C5RCJ7_9BACT|nr:hypothetical protein [Ureaplasma diversum]AJQ45631.1 hypothetical protein JM47_03720 [Ureaplasma diversum]